MTDGSIFNSLKSLNSLKVKLLVVLKLIYISLNVQT